MKVLVCGGRNYADRKKVFEILDAIQPKPDCIIEGGAKGADRLAREWAANAFVRVETYDADWKRYGHAAGPLRNKRMLIEGEPDLVIAFPGGRGTANMTAKAEQYGVDVQTPITTNLT